MSHAFDEVAETYDAVRPGYPEELFDDIARLVHLEPGSRVLEVGCGTGQATLSFARRGLRVHCVEPGGSLLEVARRKLRGYPVEFSLSRFEDWPLKKAYFDLAASGTAWHWVDPEAGYRKLSAALKPRGFIALFWNLHPTPYTGFFQEVQEVYRRRVPEWSDPDTKPTTDQRIRNRGTDKVLRFLRGTHCEAVRLAEDLQQRRLRQADGHVLRPPRATRGNAETPIPGREAAGG
ncbi:MAG TPA: class I SAM-dependent methyltransferase [Candidatus Bathyarchaeia archaeon]